MMKARTGFLSRWLVPLWLFTGLGCGAHDITLRVVDDQGDRVTGAEALVSFDYEDNTVREGESDQDGVFRARGTILPAAFVKVTKNGYYDHVIRGVRRDGDHDLTIVLRERRNPIPLVVRQTHQKVPEEDEPIGFDLEVGDWVAPHGEGKVADFVFELSREFKGMAYSGKDWEKIKRANQDETEETLT